MTYFSVRTGYIFNFILGVEYGSDSDTIGFGFQSSNQFNNYCGNWNSFLNLFSTINGTIG